MELGLIGGLLIQREHRHLTKGMSNPEKRWENIACFVSTIQGKVFLNLVPRVPVADTLKVNRNTMIHLLFRNINPTDQSARVMGSHPEGFYLNFLRAGSALILHQLSTTMVTSMEPWGK